MSTPNRESKEEALHKRVSKDYDAHEEWRNSDDYCTRPGSNSNPILDFPDADDGYVSYMWEVIKYWPPRAGWSNWYAESQILAFRRWSTFDLALGHWISGLVKPLKEQLEASRFCEHMTIDPTPHCRFVCLPYSGDILRPNFALNMEGLGKYIVGPGPDKGFKCPVMVFLVACRETLDATRDDMWRYMWMADGCRIGIIFIVNSFYDQHLNPFVVSMEIWDKQLEDSCCSDSVDDHLSAQTSPSYAAGKDEKQSEPGLDDNDTGSVDSFEWINEWVADTPIVEVNEDGFLTYKRFTPKPAYGNPAVMMRQHKEEFVVIDETNPDVEPLQQLVLQNIDFMPLCGARPKSNIEFKPITISLDSLRECIRREWDYCHTAAQFASRPRYSQGSYEFRLGEAYLSRSGWPFCDREKVMQILYKIPPCTE